MKQYRRKLTINSLGGEAGHVGKSQSLSALRKPGEGARLAERGRRHPRPSRLTAAPLAQPCDLLDWTDSSSTSQAAGVALIPSTFFLLADSAHNSPSELD